MINLNAVMPHRTDEVKPFLTELREIVLDCWFEKTRGTSIFLSLVSMVAGIAVASGMASHSPPFYVLIAIIPMFYWGAWFFSLGLLKLTVAIYRVRPLKPLVAMAGSLSWGVLAGSACSIDAHSLAWPVYGMFALAEGWIYLRAPKCAHDHSERVYLGKEKRRQE